MIRLATLEDINEILPNLPPSELSNFAAHSLDPRAAIEAALGPYTWSGLAEGRVACMFGIRFAAAVQEFPTMWLLKTELVAKHKLQFLRENRRFAAWAASEFGVIESCVAQANQTSYRWLRWLGFEEVEPISGYIRMRLNA